MPIALAEKLLQLVPPRIACKGRAVEPIESCWNAILHADQSSCNGCLGLQFYPIGTQTM